MTPAPLSHRSSRLASPHGVQLAVLAAFVLAEIGVFAAIGTNFLTVRNGFEVARLSVELGVLALALTPVIVTGGIDLSVGSLLALCAVATGALWRDAGIPIGVAAAAGVALGVIGGLVNAALVTRLRVPPLVATLGTFWLFRGLAEGITGGVEIYTGLPGGFLYLGQGYIAGWIPAQLPILAIAAVAFWAVLHRMTAGRAWSMIGYSAQGARHAGIPVGRRVALAYGLCGLAAGVAAVVYVAHVGQARADAGTNYELAAITAVVLGGTSIRGGAGSVPGTLLGLVAIAALQNGVRLADLPAELAGVLTGALLLAAIGLERAWSGPKPRIRGATSAEELDVRNSQLAVLCGVILLAAAIVAASNWMLARAVTGAAPPGARPTVPPSPARLTVAMMPKSKGNAYFIACRKGAEEAARELGAELIWDGPTETDPAKQNEVVEAWITRGVDVIAVSVENRSGLSTVLRKARRAGIKVLTWDADAEPDARDFFVNQATPEGIGRTLMDHAARILGGAGEFAIVTASLTAANQNEWRRHIEARLADRYPGVQLVTVQPCDDQQTKAFEVTTSILNAHPGVRLIMAICSPGVPGAAEAVKQSGRTDVKVIGLGLPNDNKRFVHEGVTEAVVLWNTMDLGYLTVYAAQGLRDGSLHAGAGEMAAGRLGTITVAGDNVLLGTPFTFDKSNIDGFDF